MASFRLDRTTLPRKGAIRLDNGWLRAPATLTRIGVFPYVLADGTIRRELRLPEHVFAADALGSFDLVPLTDGHPGALDSENTRKHSVGSVGHVRADEAQRFVQAELLVTDAAAIKALDNGKQELSCGYFSDLVHTPGVWTDPDGVPHRYDAIQTNIRGNHVALVDRGRAGPEARVRLDGDDAAIQQDTHHAGDGTKDTADMLKIKIDGVEYEVTPQVFQALMKERTLSADMLAAVKADAAQAKVEADKATARADAADAQIKTLTTKLDEATDTKRLDAAISERVTLLNAARKVLGDDAKLDGLTPRAIREAVVVKLDTSAKLADRSDDYVTARFDAAIAHGAAPAPVRNPATDEAAARVASGGAPTQDSAAPDVKFDEAVRNAWRRKA
jgi:hypothetical protein